MKMKKKNAKKLCKKIRNKKEDNKWMTDNQDDNCYVNESKSEMMRMFLIIKERKKKSMFS